MKFILYNDVDKFTDDVMDVLMQNEIQNNLIISNCLRGKAGVDTTEWFMGVVRDQEGALRLIALMTPPYNLVLYELNNTPQNTAIELLAKEVADLRVNIPGILSEKSLAVRFADHYSAITGKFKKVYKNMRIYRLNQVKDIVKAPGSLRIANEKDLFFLPYWILAFNKDCHLQGLDLQNSIERATRLISDQALYVWEDGVPVSQAGFPRRTMNGAVVGAVYTPPHFRGKGYATSCVAEVSRILLDSGNKFCSLFTDLENPISNSIYMKMGYKPICDYDEYKFV